MSTAPQEPRGVPPVAVALLTRKESSEAQPNRWTKCQNCGAFMYFKRLEKNLKVCPECNFHLRLPARERLAQLLDPASFAERDAGLRPGDPLNFVDTKPYPVRVAEASASSGLAEGAIYGTGKIGGHPVVIAAADFFFMGASMGSVVGEKITRAIELAAETKNPLIIVNASGGARMQEGCISLMQMAKTSAALALLAESGGLYVAVITDPTYGGVTASYASLGDIIIAEPRAMIGFAGAQIIEQTIKQKLPDDFQKSEFMLDHGMVDIILPRAELRPTLEKILSVHAAAQNPAALEPAGDSPSASAIWPTVTSDTGGDGAAASQPLTAWDIVQIARHTNRPNADDYIDRIFAGFLEMHGDRLFRDDASIAGGLALLDGRPVMVIGHQKGHNTKENIERNFGMPHPEGYRKALRLMKYADKFGLPIIAFVDTPGAYPGLQAEERGQGEAIARNLREMARLRVPVVVAIIGEGGSGGALAMAVGDRVIMLENAVYSVISPEGCAVILWKNARFAPQAAEALKMTAKDLCQLKVVDMVVPEPPGGAHLDHTAAATLLKQAILDQLRALEGIPVNELLENRYQRFRAFGEIREAGRE